MEYQTQGEPMDLHNKIERLESELDALRTQLAEEKAVYREVEERLAAAMSLLDEVATSSTSPHRDGPGCWWCIAEAGQPHEPGCKYASLSVSGVEVFAGSVGPQFDPASGEAFIDFVPPINNRHRAAWLVVRTNQETTDGD